MAGHQKLIESYELKLKTETDNTNSAKGQVMSLQ